MSLFTGNVYDKDGNAIDCKFKLYHVDTGKMSNDRDTEYQQHSADSDDSDINNGKAAFASGNTAVLAFWITGQCGIAKIVGDGSDSYVFDVQMKECQVPSTKISVSDGIVYVPISASDSSSDEYQWVYNGTTMWHKKSWFSKDWCDMVGITEVVYDWAGSGWDTPSTHTFTAIGDYLVKVKASNGCGLSAEDSKTIRVRYPSPSVSLVSDPASVIVGEETTVSITTSDPYTRITRQDWYMDGTSTSELRYVFTEIGSHEFKVVSYWNDGFDDHTFETVLGIGMKNQPPTIDMEVVPDPGGDVSKWKFISNGVDPEDDLANVKMIVYLDGKPVLEEEPPEDEYEWVQVGSKTVMFDADVQFYMGGRYKVTMQAFDGPGLSSKVDEYVFTIPYDVAECPECPEGTGSGDGTGTGDGTNVVYVDRPVYVQISAEQDGEMLVQDVSGAVEVNSVMASIIPSEVSGGVAVVEVEGSIEVVELSMEMEA